MATRRHNPSTDQSPRPQVSISNDVIQRIVSGAVSNALSEIQRSQNHGQGRETRALPSLTQASHTDRDHRAEDDDDDDFVRPQPKRRKALPSAFLSRRAKKQGNKSSCSKEFTYDRDIVCLPKSYASADKVVKIPRGRTAREYLARNGLLGKIRLASKMTEEEIMKEIRSVFRQPMDDDPLFRFIILQPSGGISKTLTAPALSSSYTWTASSVAGSAKSPIYILAENSLVLSDAMDEEHEESDDGLPDIQLAKHTRNTATKNMGGQETTNTSGQGTIRDVIYVEDEPCCSRYRAYVDLVSCDERENSPTPPPFSPISSQPERSETSVASLIQSHRTLVLPSDHTDVCRLRVRRKHLLEDTLHRFRCSLPLDKYLRITFLGEPAVDEGGPLREFLHLIVGEISRNNSLFTGSAKSRVPAHNMRELGRKTYQYIGAILALSIIYGGPAPHFLAESVADYVTYGFDKVQTTIEDIPDLSVKEKVAKLEKANDDRELQQLIQSEEFDFLYDCGIHQPLHSITLAESDTVISTIAKHYSIIVCKAELDQMIEGLATLKVLDLIRANPDVMRQLFVYMKPRKITADYLLDLFPESYSPQGSNSREAEEAAVMRWIHFIQRIEDSREMEATAPDGSTHTFKIQLQDILQFCTGAPEEPPLGFQPSPSISFQSNSPFPRANTCCNILFLPLTQMDLGVFMYYMCYGFLGSAGFGMV